MSAMSLPRPARLTESADLADACSRLRAVQTQVGETRSRPDRQHRELSAIEARQRLRALAAELDAHRYGAAGPRDP